MSTKKTDQTLKKCDELIERLNQLKKAIGGINVSSNRKPVNALGVGWSQDPSTGALHHSTHGIVSTFKHPEGGFEIRHGGGVVGRVNNIGEAGAAIKNYIANLGSTANGMQNRPSVQSQSVMQDPKLGYGNVTEKSDYGKFKGGSQYDVAANARRKMSNVGAERLGGQSVKSYTHRGTQHKEPSGAAGPVKQYSPEQIAAINEARKLKKNATDLPWVTHGSVPNADHEVQQLQRVNPAIPGEDAMAYQLANMMQSRAMMRPDHRQPTSEDMIMAGEAMGLAPSEEMIKSSEQQWHGTMNNWLLEASKPITQRFASEEEEIAYWSSIKVNGGSSGGDYGF